MDTTRTPRILTHDERKAADAAFAGRPLNPTWSEAAKRVYEGLIHALPSLPDEPIVGGDENSPGNQVQAESPVPAPMVEKPKPEQSATFENQLEPVTDVSAKQLTANRQQAIQAGLLIDVSTVAQKLGLTFPVTVTKPLWEIGIGAQGRCFDVNLVPHTLELTTLGDLQPGSAVKLDVDIIARYLERMLEAGR